MDRRNSTPPQHSVVVPVFNEQKTIAEIIRRIQAVNIDKEIIIVDDCSTDGTREFLYELSKVDKWNLPSKSKFCIDMADVRIFFKTETTEKALHYEQVLEKPEEILLLFKTQT